MQSQTDHVSNCMSGTTDWTTNLSSFPRRETSQSRNGTARWSLTNTDALHKIHRRADFVCRRYEENAKVLPNKLCCNREALAQLHIWQQKALAIAALSWTSGANIAQTWVGQIKIILAKLFPYIKGLEIEIHPRLPAYFVVLRNQPRYVNIQKHIKTVNRTLPSPHCSHWSVYTR